MSTGRSMGGDNYRGEDEGGGRAKGGRSTRV